MTHPKHISLCYEMLCFANTDYQMYKKYTKILCTQPGYVPKLLFIMKLVTLILFTSLMQVSAATFSQQVTLNEKKVTIERVIKEIRRQTGYDVLLSTSSLKSSERMDANFNSASIKEVMDKMLSGRELTYAIEDKTIMIKPKEKSFIDKIIDYIFDIRVTGKVKDKSGQAIVGVSVREKGTSNAVATNGNGEYQITVKDGATLVFSFIGFKPEERVITGKDPVNVVLEEDEAQLKEVTIVSTGYQELNKKLFTGASTSLSAKEAERTGIPDISRMLEGQVAGVSVQNVSGTFGAAPKIRVRGATSLTGDNKPLWVIDGIVLEDVVNISNEQLSTGDANTLIGSSVAGINPNDIESFQILKDAAATAMYGARAMNGVIVVTTKKGKATQGQPQVSYVANLTNYMKPSYSSFDIMNSADQMAFYLELEKKGYLNPIKVINGSATGVFGKMYNMMYQVDEESGTFALTQSLADREAYLRRAALVNTDWFDVLFKNSLMQEHSLSITSGTEKSKVYFSGGYLNDNGWTLADKVKRYTGNIRGNFDLSPKLQLGLLATSSVRKQGSPGTSSRTSSASAGQYSRRFDINPYNFATNTSRTMSVYEDDGSLAYYTNNYAPFNILNEIKNNSLNTDGLDFKLQGELRYKLTNDLKYAFDGAYRFASTKQEQLVTAQSNMAQSFRADYNSSIRENNGLLFTDPDDPLKIPVSVLPYGGFYLQSNVALSNYYVRNSLEWTKQMDKHLLNVFALGELRYIARQNSGFNGVGYQYDRGGTVFFDPQYFKYISVNGSDYYSMKESNERYLAYMARAAYSYNDKYTANATMRYDGSNLLGRLKVARWLPTWNISGAWNIDQEPFFHHQKVLSQARARLTYGLVASISNATNSAIVLENSVTNRPNLSDKENSIVIAHLENSDLTWEKQYETNLGVDLGFLHNKLTLTVDLYDRKGFDLIGLIRTSGIGGEDTKYANYADMKSRGMEFTLSGNPVNHTDFKWRTQINGAFHKSKITTLQAVPTIWDMVKQEGGMLTGYPVRSLFSIQFDGLDSRTGQPYFIDEAGNKRASAVNTSSTSLGNLVYHGPVDPVFTGGFFNSLSYKQFSVSALLTFSAGNYVRLNPKFKASYSDLDATSNNLLNRWVLPGDELKTTTPALLGIMDYNALSGYPYNNYNYSTERVAKGDFVRLKQVMLTYQVPADFAKRFWAKSASLSVVTNNLWLIYADKKLNGQDPEFFQSGGVAMPMAKQTSLSLKFNF